MVRIALTKIALYVRSERVIIQIGIRPPQPRERKTSRSSTVHTGKSKILEAVTDGKKWIRVIVEDVN